MSISLDNPASRATALAVSALVFSLLAYQGLRLEIANRKIQSPRFENRKAAVKLEPDNDEYWDRLGRSKQFDLSNPDFSQAVQYFQNAVRLDPLRAEYWMDLASAYEAQGDVARARAAFESARAAYPASADVLWQYGNFLMRQDDSEAGLPQIRQAVVVDPKFLPLAISRVWRATGDVNVLIHSVLPTTLEAYFEALDFFASIHNAGPGMVIWNGMLEMKQPFPLDRSFPFLEELISEERLQDARAVWRDVLARAGFPPNPDDSLVTDGGFNRDFPNGGFGWRVIPIPGASVDFDSTTYHSPPRSLRLDFGGAANVDLTEPYQIVPVEPDHRYQFQAFLRTESITTESGIGFYISDPHHPGAVEVSTQDLNQTHDWTSEQVDVTTGPDTHLLQISLRRKPSRLFENRLSGTVWVDDVTLVPVKARNGGS